MHSSLKLGTVFSMAALALCVPFGAKAQSLEVSGVLGQYGAYDITSPTPVSYSNEQNYVFRNGTGELVASTSDTVFGAADYGTLHALASSDLNNVDLGAYGPLADGSSSGAVFTDSVYLAPTAGYAIGTPITLSARMEITASLTAISTGPSGADDAQASFYADFSLGSQGIHVQDNHDLYYDQLSGSSTGTFDALIGDTVSLTGQLLASSSASDPGRAPGQTLATADIGNTAHFYLSAPGVSIIGLSGHDYAPPAAVPEASTTVSFGLLLALGLGGVVIAAKRKKASAPSA